MTKKLLITGDPKKVTIVQSGPIGPPGAAGSGGTYTDADAVAAMGVVDDANTLNHDRVTDGEIDARAALQDHDHATPIAAHAADAGAHHSKYTDAEAIAAVGPHFSGDATDLGSGVEIATRMIEADGAGNMVFVDKPSGGSYTDADAVAAMGVKADSNPLNHDRYTDAEADARAALLDHDHATPIAAHAGDAAAHHSRYTDAEADVRAALQDHDHAGPIATHAAIAAAHHTKYLDSEAVTAMGAKADTNPLNHDRPVSLLTTKGDLLGRSTVDARLPVGSDDQVLTADAAEALGVKWATPTGGGGESYATFTGLKPPDTADTDDEEWLTDGTLPTGWAWGNQGSASIVSGKRRIALSMPANGSFTTRGIAKAAPSGDFTVSTLLRPVFTSEGSSNQQDASLGLIWGTVATPTRLEVLRFEADQGGWLVATRLNGYTLFSTNHANEILYMKSGIAIWVRLSWDDTAEEITFEFSMDPAAEVWTTVLSGLAGPGTPPDFVALLAADTGNDARVTYYGPVRFNWTPDYVPA